MINKGKIEYNIARYYIPGYNDVRTVSVIRVFGNGCALVQPYSSGKDSKPFSIPLEHIYNAKEHAKTGKRAWESYERKRKADQKAKKKAAKK